MLLCEEYVCIYVYNPAMTASWGQEKLVNHRWSLNTGEGF